MCTEIMPSCTEAKNHAIWRLCKQDYKAPRYPVPVLLISLAYLEAWLVQNAALGPDPNTRKVSTFAEKEQRFLITSELYLHAF